MYIDENDVRTPRERVRQEDMTRYLFSEPRTAQGDCRVANTGGRDCRGMNTGRLDCRGRNTDTGDCRGNRLPHGTPLAAVYVPIQTFAQMYDCDKALSRGTLFMELDKPFEGRGRR